MAIMNHEETPVKRRYDRNPRPARTVSPSS
jgi:hypothetical protein